MDIAALLSGGVDSSVVVHLLCEQGYKPTLFYIKIGMDGAEYMDCSAEEDIELSVATARKYGLSLEVVDLHQEYWENVAAYAIDKVRQGLTPNPDVMCNKLIKFGCFEQRVGKDFDFTATGHYATILQRNGKTWLGTAKDPVKDQTDFLAQIDYLQVSKLMFPIGGLMKQEVREIALSAGLPSARRKDSQGICFLGKINYNDFVRRFLGEKEGAIIELETGKKLGTHRGYWFHTIGQRKGLGLSGGPWFVIKKDIQENIIYVSHGYGVETQYGNEFRINDFHFITDNPWTELNKELDITFKIRHTPEFTKGKLVQEGENRFRILSSEKLQGIAPGQFGVVYDKAAQVCVGSGEIFC
ncbi:tRNA 2-thiouridine(34) synthase MnmA [Bacteroides acidifaciens]|uniref:tRNA 2-thiouridine(34) synthase MnmA n=1 Tax=Bacteroides acidifaciens TaxID=85831 RepID=UPI00214A180C|nr:tRNA 2-thiouridine(34) synthase MnmA [Bacteroides acidifaciens]MCR2007437.1 tRNA 2-thiouridine(34) synthase MnmA [Bacteroides acidifaciens]